MKGARRRSLRLRASWDRCVVLLHERTGLTSLADVKEQRYPLRLSMREDPTHSTRSLIDQLGRDTEATPLDVPLHPGAERWYQGHSP